MKKKLIILFTVIIIIAGAIFIYIDITESKRDQVIKKPVIYLYPKEKTDVKVELTYSGKLTTTYPKYNPQTGWQVQAEPNGHLYDARTNEAYRYLYWEGESSYQYHLKNGFVVKGSETAQFLRDKCAYLGLSMEEYNEMIIFWLPEMEKNAYNLIHFSTDEYEQQAKLKITPQPDEIIRVFMVYKPLQENIAIPEQQLVKKERHGFTVVEWGGMKAV